MLTEAQTLAILHAMFKDNKNLDLVIQGAYGCQADLPFIIQRGWYNDLAETKPANLRSLSTMLLEMHHNLETHLMSRGE